MKRPVSPETLQLMQHIAERMKALRLQKKWSRLEAAIEADINPNYYSRIERGKTGTMRINTLLKLSRGFGVPPDFLLDF